eukprot:6491776-Amphidinium_carterae.2
MLSSVGGNAGTAEPWRAQLYPWDTARPESCSWRAANWVVALFFACVAKRDCRSASAKRCAPAART